MAMYERGELEGIRVITLAERLQNLIAPETSASRVQLTPDTGLLLVDASAVRFLDSSGILFLVKLHQNVARQKGRMVISGLGEPIRRILTITRVERLFNITPTCAEGLAILSGDREEGR